MNLIAADDLLCQVIVSSSLLFQILPANPYPALYSRRLPASTHSITSPLSQVIINVTQVIITVTPAIVTVTPAIVTVTAVIIVNVTGNSNCHR